MLSTKKSLLPVGIRSFFKPSVLFEAIDNCLRLVSEPLAGSDSLVVNDTDKLPRGLKTAISIPLSNVRKNYRHLAADIVVAGSDKVSGETDSGWRVFGLPPDLVLVSKSPDSSECLLVGCDFIENENSYLFYKNPLECGIIAVNGPEPMLSIYCLSCRPDAYDYLQTTRTDRNFGSRDNRQISERSTDRYLSVNGACGSLSAAATGMFSCGSEGVLERLWTEGNYKIGVVGDSFVYANKSDKTKNLGEYLNIGDTLVDDNHHTGSILALAGVGYWFDGTGTAFGDCRTVALQSMPYIEKSNAFQQLLENIRPDVACNPLLQYVDLSLNLSETLTDAEWSDITRIWIMYSANQDFTDVPPMYTGLTTNHLKSYCISRGGCMICSPVQQGEDTEGGKVLISLSLNSDTFGSRPSAGNVVYGIALEEAGTDKIHKIIIPERKIYLIAQATVVVRLFENLTAVGSGESGTPTVAPGIPGGIPEDSVEVDDDLTIYWLKTVQDILVD